LHSRRFTITVSEKQLKANKKNAQKGGVKKVYLPMVNPEIFLDGKVDNFI